MSFPRNGEFLKVLYWGWRGCRCAMFVVQICAKAVADYILYWGAVVKAYLHRIARVNLVGIRPA